MRRLTALSIVSLLLVSGCGFDFAAWLGLTPPSSPPVPEAAKLRKFTSPDELKSYLVSQNQNAFSRDSVFTLTGGAENADNSSSSSESPTATSPTDGGQNADNGSANSTPNFSTTTEQEEGVQESDIVKNDGEYLYVLSHGVLHIVRAAPASGLVETGSLDLEGSGQEMFLVDGKIVTITTPNFFSFISEPIGIAVDFSPGFEMYRPQARVTVVDISDKSNPTVASEALIDGTINTSRMIGTQLYLVAVTYPDVYIEPILMAEGGVGVGSGARRGSGSGSAATQANALSLSDIELDDILPDIAINVGGQEVYKGNITAFDEHFRPVGPDGLGLTSIISLDINDPASYSAQTVVAYPANVYASTQAIYLTDTDYDFSGNFRETTNLYKFALTGSGTTQAAAGTVPGRVLNQYSMGEYGGFLRVATTTGPTFEPFGQGSTSTNAVYVLEQVGEKLDIAGKIEGLAPGESVFAARFLGARGYLVTFEQVDPLFTLDLSNPRDPKVVGELKVPGFSTFITPMDENHVLTIGRDMNDALEFTFADGIRVSIFDVTDFSAPKLAHVEVIGSNGAWSEAIDNPKAFTYFAAGDLLAFPVEIFGNRFVADFPVDSPEDDVEVSVAGESPGAPPENDIGTDGIGTNGIGTNGEDVPIDIELPPVPTDSFRGLYVYRVTAEDGFELLGTIDTSTGTTTGDSFFYGPSFTRGAFIGETVYAVTSEGVSAAAIADVSTITASVAFANDAPDNQLDGPPPAGGTMTTTTAEAP